MSFMYHWSWQYELWHFSGVFYGLIPHMVFYQFQDFQDESSGAVSPPASLWQSLNDAVKCCYRVMSTCCIWCLPSYLVSHSFLHSSVIWWFQIVYFPGCIHVVCVSALECSEQTAGVFCKGQRRCSCHSSSSFWCRPDCSISFPHLSSPSFHLLKSFNSSAISSALYLWIWSSGLWHFHLFNRSSRVSIHRVHSLPVASNQPFFHFTILSRTQHSHQLDRKLKDTISAQ